MASADTHVAYATQPERVDQEVQPPAIELRELQRNLLRAVTAGHDRQSVLAAVGRIVNECMNPVAIRYYAREDGGRLAPTWQLVPGGADGPSQGVEGAILQCCNAACAQGCLQTTQIDGDPRTLAVAVPVFLRKQAPEAFTILLPHTTRSLERILVTLQLVASHVSLWHILQESGVNQRDARATAAVLEMIAKLGCCDDLRHACYTLVCELKEYLAYDNVAVGLCRGRRGDCYLEALSEHARFDRNSARTRAFEAAFDEAILKGTLSEWPSAPGAAQHSARALEHLCSATAAAMAVSGPLHDEQGEPVGAWVFLASKNVPQPEDGKRFVHAAAGPVGASLRLLRRAERGRLARFGHALVKSRRSWRAPAALLAMCALTAVLALPVPYRVKCECEVQPVTRRFVVAPFDGRLEQVFARPGDVLAKDDALARMDGRDIRWELASLIAEHGRAAKRRDAAMASHDVVTAQLAKLEMEKLEANMAMLEHRADNLEIKSPIDGIVISGDQQRTEGAPLNVGQALFEIAPLDRMIVEVAIPEEDIDQVRDGLGVSVRLDAFPRREWTGTICALHPRSETRDDHNVFVAEVAMDNPDDLLRPGMNGRAKVTSDPRPLAWNLFHKPWEQLLTVLGL